MSHFVRQFNQPIVSPPQSDSNQDLTKLRCLLIAMTMLNGLAFLFPAKTHATELIGSVVEATAINFPGSGSGQIELGTPPKQLGESGMTVRGESTALSNGDELLQLWWSNPGGEPNALAANVSQPSFLNISVGSPTARPLITSSVFFSMTIDDEPITPSNPFGLPPLNNIGPHPYDQESSVVHLSGPPPGGYKYGEDGRLNIRLSSGVFAGQTFYQAGNVPPSQGGTPPPFGDAGGLDMFGYGAMKSEINGIYNSWVVRQAPIGDSNLDGVFDSSDLIRIFQEGQYEDGVELNSDWRSGDWNGDHEFDSSDLVFAMESGGYEVNRRPVNAVPEPNGMVLLLFGCAVLITRKRGSGFIVGMRNSVRWFDGRL